jgi:hypothetical protein
MQLVHCQIQSEFTILLVKAVLHKTHQAPWTQMLFSIIRNRAYIVTGTAGDTVINIACPFTVTNKVL